MHNVEELLIMVLIIYVLKHHHQLVHQFMQPLKDVQIPLELMVYASYLELLLKHVKDLIHVLKQQNKVHVYLVNFHACGLHQQLHQQQVHVHH